MKQILLFIQMNYFSVNLMGIHQEGSKNTRIHIHIPPRIHVTVVFNWETTESNNFGGPLEICAPIST